MKLVGDIDLELAEHAPESREMLRVDPLPGEAQNAMGAERPQDAPEVILGDGTGQIDIVDAGAQRAAAGSDFHLPLALVTVLALDRSAFSHHVELARSQTVARKRDIRVLSLRQALSAIKLRPNAGLTRPRAHFLMAGNDLPPQADNHHLCAEMGGMPWQ
jgi:hypothetical protein